MEKARATLRSGRMTRPVELLLPKAPESFRVSDVIEAEMDGKLGQFVVEIPVSDHHPQLSLARTYHTPPHSEQPTR